VEKFLLSESVNALHLILSSFLLRGASIYRKNIISHTLFIRQIVILYYLLRTLRLCGQFPKKFN